MSGKDPINGIKTLVTDKHACFPFLNAVKIAGYVSGDDAASELNPTHGAFAYHPKIRRRGAGMSCPAIRGDTRNAPIYPWLLPYIGFVSG